MAKTKSTSVRNKKILLIFLLFAVLFTSNMTISSAYETSSTQYQPEFVPDDYSFTYGSVSSGALSDVSTNNGHYWSLSPEYVAGMYEYVCSVEMTFEEEGKFDEIGIEVDISGTGNTYYVYVQYNDSTQSSAISLTDGTTVETLESGSDYSSVKNVEGLKIYFTKISSFLLNVDLCRAYEIDGIYCDDYTINIGSLDSGVIGDTQEQDGDELIFEDGTGKVISVTLEFSTKTYFDWIYVYYTIDGTWWPSSNLVITVIMDDAYEADVPVSSEETFIALNSTVDFPSSDEVVSIRFYYDKNVHWVLELDYVVGFDY